MELNGFLLEHSCQITLMTFKWTRECNW